MNLLYTYYILSLQNWCQPEYKIHGLWANISPTTYPTCNYTTFSENLLKSNFSLEKEMYSYWNNDCLGQTSISLWEHEYNKHLNCITEQTGMTQNEVFEKTIQLYKEYNETVCLDLKFNKIDCNIIN